MTSVSSVSAEHSSADSVPVPRLILASSSPARQKLLRDSGVIFDVQVSDVDEDEVLARATERAHAEGRGDLTAAEVSVLLAHSKAHAVARSYVEQGVQDTLVLGCDSVFEFDGEIHGKPHTPEKARERLRAMSGRSGVLHTGHCLVDLRSSSASQTRQVSDLSEVLPSQQQVRSATVHLAPMSASEIDAYLTTGEPLQVAGSFTIDGYGAAFIRGIEGESHTVIGLSVNALHEMLSAYGLSISDFWKSR